MTNLSIAIIAVGVILLLILIGLKLYSDIKLKGLRQVAIDLISEAENAFEKGKNNEKFQHVLTGLYNKLPVAAQAFLSEETIVNFIQKIFDSIKIALDAGRKE